MITYRKEDIRNIIIEKGIFSRGKNEDIYNKLFAHAPRYLFRAVDEVYRFSKKSVADVGCSYGMNLFHCSKDSYGIDIDGDCVLFANAIGLAAFNRDIISEGTDGLPKVDYIWCSSVIEHIHSPSLFLERLFSILKPGGLLFLSVPTVPAFRSLEKSPFIGQYIRGYATNGHIYAFTPFTLDFLCQRSQFEKLELSPFFPGVLSLFNKVPFIRNLIGRCVFVGRKS